MTDATISAERQLWDRLRNEGDEQARQSLLALHLPFARIMAARLYAGRVHDEFEFDEYLQMATVALIESLDRYDPSRGAQFRTFAHYRLHGAILSGLEKLSERQQQVSLQKRLRADRLSLAAQSAAPARNNADQLFLYLAEVGIGLALGTLLDATNVLEQEEGWGADQAYGRLELKQFAGRLTGLIARLTERERQVIRGHYLQAQTFEEVARQLGISKARVSQLHYQGLQRLRTLLTDHAACDVAW